MWGGIAKYRPTLFKMEGVIPMLTNVNSIVPFLVVGVDSEISTCIEAISNSEILGIDIETTGLDCHSNKIRLLQIAPYSKDKSFNPLVYIIDFFNMYEQDIQSIGKALMQSTALKLFHNAKFDLKFLWSVGIRLDCNIYDTLLAEQVLDSGAYRRGFGLKDLAYKYHGIDLDKGFQSSDWSTPLTQKQLEYSALDAHVLRFIYQEQSKVLTELELMDTAQLENLALIPTIRMELTGIKVDKRAVRELLMNLAEDKADILEDLSLLLPDVENFNSPIQVKTTLQKMGLPIESTEKSELTKYCNDFVEIEKILAYKKIVKSISLIEGMRKEISPITGRIHANYKQCSTVTGRYSCSQPNIQGIPKKPEFRKCFVADEGNVFIIADYNQIELRIIAEVTEDIQMMKAYANNQDIHCITASLVNSKPISEVTEEERSSAKAMNFGLIYGMGYKMFRQYALNNYGIALNEYEVSEQVNKFFATYGGIANRLNILNSMYTLEERTIGNRRRLWQKPPIITERANASIQGTGADILKRALVRINEHLLSDDVRLVAIVHDEIVIEVSKSQADDVSMLLKELMETAGMYYLKKVPVIADVKISRTWA